MFASRQMTVYRVADGRGYDVAAGVLGDGYDWVIERDGWAPYRRFVDATHQTCLAHLLRRCGNVKSIWPHRDSLIWPHPRGGLGLR